VLFRNFAGMKNPFSIIRLVFKATRPSRLQDMKAVKDAFWMKPNYAAMTFFGFIVTATQREADKVNEHYDSLKNHEMIHLRQAEDCHDSWLLFYIRYGWYYLRALPYNRKKRNAAYWMNPFELEAYEHEHDLDYLKHRPAGGEEWRKYARMTPKKRFEKLFLRQK
jgi:hypothetical protein